MLREKYIEDIVEKVNKYTKNSICQIELKYSLRKASDNFEIKQLDIPSFEDRIFIFKRSRKISQTNEVLNNCPVTFRKYEIDIISIFGFKLKSFTVEIFQPESEEDLSIKEILEKIGDKSYSFEYFAKKYKEHVEYKAFDEKTGLVFYEQHFQIKKED